jgi:glycosyltransferase involved in cell wall biosynthesis
MQQTTFPYEILVHEDASTDNTSKILKKYEKKYSKLFSCVYQTENQFAIQNTLVNILFPNSRGKYIALCEGDDYWTDPYKLQKQVDFLENHPDYSLSCHLVNILNDETKEVTHFAKDYNIGNKNREISIYDFLDPFLIITCSLVFRKNSFNNKKRWGFHFKDITLFAELLSKGKGMLLKDCMAVYRQHDGGIWSKKTNLMKCKANAYTLIEMNKYYKYNIRHIKTNASLQILDYLNLLIADKEKNILEKSKIFLILMLHYREDIGNKMLLKLLKRILKSIA